MLERRLSFLPKLLERKGQIFVPPNEVDVYAYRPRAQHKERDNEGRLQTSIYTQARAFEPREDVHDEAESPYRSPLVTEGDKALTGFQAGFTMPKITRSRIG